MKFILNEDWDDFGDWFTDKWRDYDDADRRCRWIADYLSYDPDNVYEFAVEHLTPEATKWSQEDCDEVLADIKAELSKAKTKEDVFKVIRDFDFEEDLENDKDLFDWYMDNLKSDVEDSGDFQEYINDAKASEQDKRDLDHWIRYGY